MFPENKFDTFCDLASNTRYDYLLKFEIKLLIILNVNIYIERNTIAIKLTN